MLFLIFLIGGATGLSVEKCQGSQSGVSIDDFSLSPDLVVVPGKVHINLAFTTQYTLENLKVEISLEKVIKKASWLFGAITAQIPCPENLRAKSCVYDDVCAMLGQLDIDCPATIGQHTVQETIDVPLITAPGFAGTYNVKIQLTDNVSGEDRGCFDILDLYITRDNN